MKPGEVTRIDPLNPPPGVICIAIIQTTDLKTGQSVIDVQGHIKNEKYAVDLMLRAIQVLKGWHEKNRAEGENDNGGKNN